MAQNPAETFNHHYQTMYITHPNENPFAGRAPQPPVEYTEDVDVPPPPPTTVVTAPPPAIQPPHFPLDQKVEPSTIEGTTTTTSNPSPTHVNHPIAVPQSVQVTLSSAMRMLGDLHTNLPGVQRAWYTRAETFDTRGSPSGSAIPPPSSQSQDSPDAQSQERPPAAVRVAKDLGIGMAYIVGAPIAVAGAAVVASGGVLYGVGLMLKGIGGAMTCGLAY